MMRRFMLFFMVLISLLLVACAGQPAKHEDKNIDEFNSINQDEDGLTQSLDDTAESPLLGQFSGAKTQVNLYFLDESLGQLVPEVRKVKDNNSSLELVKYTLNELISGPETDGLSPVISKDVEVNNVELTEDILAVDLSSEFYKSKDVSLARAAIANSLLDLGDYRYIRLSVDGREASDTLGENAGLVGLLTRYPVSVNEISAFEIQSFSNADVRKINRELFFQDYSGSYLLPEVRTISVRSNNYVEAIVNELIKGPSAEGEGYYPTLPKGTVLVKTEPINISDGNSGIALYFSKEFKGQNPIEPSQEASMLSSLVYSLSSLPQVNFVKVYYDNGKGEYIDEPLCNIPLDQELTMDYFPDRIGRRIKVYYGDGQNMLLQPEYRAVAYNEDNLAMRILSELAKDPIAPGSIRVFPQNIKPESVSVKIDDQLATVDIPSAYFESVGYDNNRIIRDLYAVVNTLTDPVNMCNVKEVQFTIDGNVVDSYKDISLKETFVMNPAMIKTE